MSFMAEASCLQTTEGSIVNEFNYNQQVSRQPRSSQPNWPENGEITAVSSAPTTLSEEPNFNYCAQVSLYALRLDQPLIQTSTVHYLDILTYVINSLNVLSSSSLMRKDEGIIEGTGPSGVVECFLSQAAYGIGSFSQTNPNYYTVKKEAMLLNALFLKREEKIRFLQKTGDCSLSTDIMRC